ncbi:AAA family ATPase [Streptococcus didelphis]|uniref:AAA family ATPase n=1 Tax=Streptococcus didelphis TaxID=102886 RepID=UPI0027D2C146|nr:AAA family ATPase [Streptococcus didelphis]WMB29675.1 AAA family ATPase [Streptococcus didelphis]
MEETKAKIEVLNNLPGSDSNNWEAFIREGTYISENTPELNSKCPYCHRDHDDKSLELVQAYLVYLNNESTKDLSDTEKLLKSIASLASTTSVKNNDISLDSYRNLEDIEALSTNVGNYINNLKSNQEELKEIQPIKYKTDKIKIQIKSHIKELKSQKKLIEETKLEKNKLIEEKNNEYQKLVLHQNTHNKIDTIKKYISEKNEIFKQNKRVNKNNTRQLSNLSKKAHDELLSQQLVSQFQKNLSYFEIPNREISLKNITSAGKQQTELIIKSNKKIKKILSEGEQKSVALALFLAEISLSKNKSTLIFDDPVNSLDNRMMNKFIKLLLELENQIIIFSHNQYFFDLLTTQKQLLHSCKENNYNGCTNKSGKHLLIYEVSSDGINDAGYIRFNNINTTAKAYLKKQIKNYKKHLIKNLRLLYRLDLQSII